jgi:hypothetical protein
MTKATSSKGKISRSKKASSPPKNSSKSLSTVVFSQQNPNKSLTGKRGNPNWTKGVSANPGGRPRVIGDLKKLVRSYTDEAISALVDVMNNKAESGSARVSAAQALLDRGYGKPLQQVELGHPGDFSAMNEEEVDQFINRAYKDLGHLKVA